MSTKKLHLQGLRAVAIISVVLFHFFPDYFPNGYLGVDQFFLLSGYLMTMMLDRSLHFSIGMLLDFWYRRIKRLVPLYYLVTLCIIGSVFLLPISAIRTNFESGLNAVTFLTNVVRPLGDVGYEEKLGTAVDMFTHTWSLCVEMQFYLVFPFLYFGIKYCNIQCADYLIFVIAGLSLYYQCVTDSFLSFNSVFSRMWEFLAGMYAFKLVDKNSNCEEHDDLLPKKTIKSIKSFAILSTITLLIILLFSIDLKSTLLKIYVITLTTIVVNCSEGMWILENKVVVFIGEISYSWYLVHWPIVAFLKLYNSDEMLHGLVFSLFIGVIVHFTFEKWYLTWEKLTICIISILLLIGNLGIFRVVNRIVPTDDMGAIHITANVTGNSTKDPFIWESDFLDGMTTGYENKTNEEKAKLIEAYDSNDMKQLFSHPCNRLPGQSPVVPCTLPTDSSNVVSKDTLLVMGNSYAANVISIIFEECKDAFQNISISFLLGCEPLVRTPIPKIDCTMDKLYLKAVKEINPDVLFIADRHMEMMEIRNGTSSLNDGNFKIAVERLRDLEPFVKKRIFILDAIPRATLASLTSFFTRFLRKGTPFTDEELINHDANYMIAKERLSRLVGGCQKCRLYDYKPQFYYNGKFKLYDSTIFMPYFTNHLHLSPLGLERVRPLYRHLCHNI